MFWWIFDAAVFIFLILSGAFLLHLAVDWKSHKKRMRVWLLVLVLAVAWMVIFYGSFIAPLRIVITNQNISFSEQSLDSLKIVVISDLHIGRYKDFSWTRKIVDRVNTLQPDIILLDGDYIFDYSTNVEMLDALTDLHAPEGVFAVTGNHDYDGNRNQDVILKLKELGITVLENEQVLLRPADKNLPRLVLVGVSDIWFEGDISLALAGVSEEDQVILLVHNPDAALDKAAGLADLIISGHTHGGQIRLPFIGPIGPIPTHLGQEYDRGLFSSSRRGAKFGTPNSNQQLFITSGLGETGARARLFNPPEIALLFLER